MATGLIFYDGFDDNTSASASTEWIANNTAVFSTARPRSGARSLQINNSGEHCRIVFSTISSTTNSTDVIVGIAYNLNVASIDAVQTFLSFLEGTGDHINLRITNGNVLRLYRGSTQIGSDGPTVSFDTWTYLEVRAIIHDTTGVAELRVNGQAPSIVFSGDTRNGGAGVIDGIRLGAPTGIGPGTYYIDDFYVVDRTVAGSNYLGDVRVDSLVVDGPGDDDDFTPLTGANYENVDDETPDSDTTYNESAAVNAKDTFTLQDTLNQGATIYGVAHIMTVRKTDAGSRTVRGLLKSGATTANQITRAPNTTYQTFFQHNENVPGGTGWTEANVNGLKVGYEIVS